jgi:predicted small lipoprotein YifL
MNRQLRPPPFPYGKLRRCLTALSASGLLLGAGGCGQKGALYLPDPAPQSVPTTTAQPPTATPAAADEDTTKRKLPRPPDPAASQ